MRRFEATWLRANHLIIECMLCWGRERLGDVLGGEGARGGAGVYGKRVRECLPIPVLLDGCETRVGRQGTSGRVFFWRALRKAESTMRWPVREVVVERGPSMGR
jgi:hypothetical protein